VDGRIEAVRAALAQRRFDDAAAALDELIELDPTLPIRDELTAELNQQRDAAAIGHRGPWIAATAACAVCLALFALLMSASQKSGPLISHPLDGSAMTVAPTLPASAVAPAAGAPTDNPIVEPASPGDAEPTTVVEARRRRSETPVEQDRLSTVSTPRPAGFADRDEPGEPPRPAPVPQLQEQTTVVAITSAAASIPADDEALIRQTLRRYEDAYKTPDVQAQSLLFDGCQIDVRGSSARAICRGARSVPRSGRREPRTDRRVWSFTLTKQKGDWTIETARTDQ
jgi:hypothetical protein